jgi:hypothetical protein
MDEYVKDSVNIKLISSYKEIEDIYEQLIPIYQEIYSAAPDFQFWSESFIKECFLKYFSYGNIFMAFKNKDIVGFCVSMPLSTSDILKSSVYSKETNDSNGVNRKEENISDILKEKYKINIEKCAYIVDFGVNKIYRNIGMGSILFDKCCNYSNEDVLTRASTRKSKVVSYYVNRGFFSLELYQYPVYNYVDKSSGEEEKIILLKKRNIRF